MFEQIPVVLVKLITSWSYSLFANKTTLRSSPEKTSARFVMILVVERMFTGSALVPVHMLQHNVYSGDSTRERPAVYTVDIL
jgi:hypothetical protein